MQKIETQIDRLKKAIMDAGSDENLREVLRLKRICYFPHLLKLKDSSIVKDSEAYEENIAEILKEAR